jgi:GT2 family glycosyltransferase
VTAPGVATPPRTLVGVLVYGGEEFVPACLESAALLTAAGDVDVIVLDDHSPDAAWAATIAAQCEQLGIGYYRSPRNLGIPRNMNLTLLRAMDEGYDHVVIANSDVVFPTNLVPELIAAAAQDSRIASVTAWSNHVSAFSLENLNAPENIATQAAIDRVSELLAAHFAHRVVDVPVGVGFCMLMPVPMVREIGLFDPIFGRGYCEEVDWCLRADALGYRNVLAPSTYLFHIGNATSKAYGVLEHWETSDPHNEAIIDLRYAGYRDQLEAHDRSRVIHDLRAEGERVLLIAAATDHGYVLEVSGLGREFDYGPEARFVVDPAGSGRTARAFHGGYEAEVRLAASSVPAQLTELVGRAPRALVVRERGAAAERLVAECAALGVPVVDEYRYPQAIAPVPESIGANDR